MNTKAIVCKILYIVVVCNLSGSFLRAQTSAFINDSLVLQLNTAEPLDSIYEVNLARIAPFDTVEFVEFYTRYAGSAISFEWDFSEDRLMVFLKRLVINGDEFDVDLWNDLLIKSARRIRSSNP